MRPSGRDADQMRVVCFTPDFTRHAEGSVLVEFGDTRVLCTASVENRVPPWLRGSGGGWVTGEYGMLPRATNTRSSREATRGKQSGRTLEIQRLIGRSLRAIINLEALGERTITLDCDVIQADGSPFPWPYGGCQKRRHLPGIPSTVRSQPCRLVFIAAPLFWISITRRTPRPKQT